MAAEPDTPCPITACWLHWIAVPTGDQTAVMDLMGLTDARPVPFAEAVAAVDDDAHEPDERYHRVHVTPELDGWTLVAGFWCDPAEDDAPELLARLSAQFGRAQAYYFGAQGDGSAWLIAEDGNVVRRCVHTGEPSDAALTIGEPLPYETELRAAANDDEDWETELWTLAPTLAAALSIDRHRIGPTTRHHGRSLLARTPQATTPTP